MKNLPTKQKLTTKGNIPQKLATVGIDAAELYHYNVAIDADDGIDISALASDIAEQVVEAVCESFPADTWDSVNGAGYVDNWKRQIAADVEAVALGTAAQGRAFKQTVCDNVEGCTMAHFAADGKAASKKVVEDNPFA